MEPQGGIGRFARGIADEESRVQRSARWKRQGRVGIAKGEHGSAEGPGASFLEVLGLLRETSAAKDRGRVLSVYTSFSGYVK